jgi:hypothetical protein
MSIKGHKNKVACCQVDPTLIKYLFMTEIASRGEYIKAVFGSRHRLDIWASVTAFSIEPPEPFFALEITRSLGDNVSRGFLHQELQTMSRLGMVAFTGERQYKEGQSNGNYPKWLVRTASPLWELVDVAVRVVDTEFPPSE